MNNEKTYPIYKFSARWNQDDFENNSTGSSIMYREEPSPLLLARDLAKWWRKVLTDKRSRIIDRIPFMDKNPKLLELKIEFSEYESWCIVWFNHYTFNIDLSDEKLKQSFYAFVQRKRPAVRNSELPKDEQNPDVGTYCLMGAEDTWRWKEPCRCKHCIKLGKVTINH